MATIKVLVQAPRIPCSLALPAPSGCSWPHPPSLTSWEGPCDSLGPSPIQASLQYSCKSPFPCEVTQLQFPRVGHAYLGGKALFSSTSPNSTSELLQKRPMRTPTRASNRFLRLSKRCAVGFPGGGRSHSQGSQGTGGLQTQQCVQDECDCWVKASGV